MSISTRIPNPNSPSEVRQQWRTLIADINVELELIGDEIDRLDGRIDGKFSLDQTTPETVFGGIPNFSTGIAVDDDDAPIYMGFDRDFSMYFDGLDQQFECTGRFSFSNSIEIGLDTDALYIQGREILRVSLASESIKIGDGAGIGIRSVTIGTEAGDAAVLNRDMYIGRRAGRGASGSANVGVGITAGSFSGGNWVAIGDLAGDFSGSDFVAIGRGSGSVSTQSNYIALGRNAVAIDDNELVIGADSSPINIINIGVGLNRNPLIYGDINKISTDVVFETNSGNVRAVSAKTANYTLLASDYSVVADGTSGVVTISLPAAPVTGQVYNIACLNSDNAVTVGLNGKAFYDSTSDILLFKGENVTLQYTGTEWIGI